LEERLKEREGMARVAAAQTGNVSFEPDGNGKLRVSYLRPEATKRKWESEQVDDLPASLTGAVLRTALTADEEEGVEVRSAFCAACGETLSSREIFFLPPVGQDYLRMPELVAGATPRIFWAIVRHGGVGPEVGFKEALGALAPNLPTEQVGRRKRKRPTRYDDAIFY